MYSFLPHKLEKKILCNWILCVIIYHIMQKFLKNMLQYYHGWNSNMDNPRKQYNVTTFLPPLKCAFTWEMGWNEGNSWCG
jgi:hypothetical protein